MRAKQMTTQKSFTVVGKTVANDCKKQQTKTTDCDRPSVGCLRPVWKYFDNPTS